MTLDRSRAAWLRQLDAGRELEPEDWREAWRGARDVGPALSSVLWDRLRRDRRPGRRLVWIGAYVAATGSGGRLAERTWLRAAKKPERVMALLAMSLAERSPEDRPALRRVVLESPSDAVRIAGCLVLARANEPTRLPPSWFSGPRQLDPGLCAAAVLCGGDPPSEVLDRWLARREAPGPAEQLVWRAELWSRHSTPYVDDLRHRLARRALAWQGGGASLTRGVAALQISRARDPSAWLGDVAAPLPAEEVLLLARSEAGRDLIEQRGWLSPVPSPRLDPALRRKLAVQFVVRAKPAEIARAAQRWGSDDGVASSVCLALAWRAWQQADLADGAWVDELTGIPESAWTRLALGREIEPNGLPEGVSGALRMAVDGRLPTVALAREVERELWRQGSHPGALEFDSWTALVRDILLSGSDYARTKDTRREQFPYLASDLQRDDRAFFEVACEYLRWVTTDRWSVPEVARLDVGK